MNFFIASTFLILIYNIGNTVFAIKSSDADLRNHLGSRTPYRFRYNKNDTKINYSNCQDIKIWMIVRHGTRLPSRKDIIGMQTKLKDLKYEILLSHNSGRGHLNKEEIDRLKHWSTDLSIEQANDLTFEGENEMEHLAKRMHRRLPDTIKNRYNNITFLFRYTSTQRAEQSAKHFTIGLFGKNESEDVLFAPTTKVDPVLRFYEHCEKWQKQVKKNPKTYEELRLFSDTKQMNDTLQLISNKLGLEKKLSLGKLKLMYKVCGFETSWHKHEVSPWCSAFDEETIKVAEYLFDLKHYWKDGYGHPLTYRQACLGVKHMFQSFSNMKGPDAIFMFTHSGTILKIISHLGLYKPVTHLRGDRVDESREWRASQIDSFGTNLAFILYKCEDEYKVLTLHQEKPVRLPMCEHELCSLNHLTEHFDESINNCDYNALCSLHQRMEL